MAFIHETAKIFDSNIGEVKLYRNVSVNHSSVADGCSIGDDTTLERCVLDSNVVINRRSYVNDSNIGSFTYAGINLIMNWTKIGKFCSLAHNVYIGGGNHNYHRASTMPSFRLNQMLNGGGRITYQQEMNDYCVIGNDVWIAARVTILNGVKIGDGVVIGAGAVVNKDIPPYAIVVGVPARIIGYRFSAEIIADMLDIKWWNWPIELIKANTKLLLDDDLDKDTVSQLKIINDSLLCNNH